MLRVEEALTDEGDRAEQRHRVAAAAATAAAERDMQAQPACGRPAGRAWGSATAPICGSSTGAETFTSALCPLKSPADGVASTVVMPVAGESRQLRRIGAQHLGRFELRPEDHAALPALGLFRGAERGRGSRRPRRRARRRCPCRSGRDRRVIPVPSITVASAGGCTVAPTASISPLRMTIVPLAIGAPAAVTSRAPLIA